MNWKFIFFRWPWNQNTLHVWMFETIFNGLIVFVVGLVTSALLTLFVSICHYHGAFYKIFQLQIANIDQATYSRPMKCMKIRKLINESISLHISAKR